MTEKEVFELYKWDVYKTCYYMLQNQHDAEDITQNVFIKVFNSGYQSIDNLKAWIITISMNMCKNHLNKNKRTVLVDSFNEAKENVSDENIEIAYEHQQLKENMIELLSKLPDRARSVIILKYLHDMKYSEISNLLNITEGSAKASCHYGLKLLRGYIPNQANFYLQEEGI